MDFAISRQDALTVQLSSLLKKRWRKIRELLGNILGTSLMDYPIWFLRLCRTISSSFRTVKFVLVEFYVEPVTASDSLMLADEAREMKMHGGRGDITASLPHQIR